MAGTTGWSGYDRLFVDGPYSTSQKYTNAERRLNRLMRKGQGTRRLRAIIYPLLGAVVGGAASLTVKREQAVSQLGSITGLGGLRPIETNTIVNRVTTAADLAKVQDDLVHPNKPVPYPAAKGNTLGYTVGGMSNKVA